MPKRLDPTIRRVYAAMMSMTQEERERLARIAETFKG
jgi:hypothetical protein